MGIGCEIRRPRRYRFIASSFHYRVNLKEDRIIESAAGIRKYKNKDYELTWVCNDIKRNHMIFRKKFLENCDLDLY